MGDADDIGNLHFDAVGQSGSHHVLGNVPCHIAGGAVDLGRVFAREGSTAMAGIAAVGID